MASNSRVVSICLIGLAIALLLVGVVSGTILRHVVQILPLVVAVIVVEQRPLVGAWAALAIFSFWTFIVLLIWLFLLGLSGIASGRYTSVEIICTFLMAAFSVVGAVKGVALGRALRAPGRVIAFVTFALLQVAAMWISLLRPIANR